MDVAINIYLTWNCNFYCDHCIHECGPKGNHMTDEQLVKAFDFITWLKSFNYKLAIIGVTGGEATLHPKFWSNVIPELVRVRQLHGLQYVELHTNGSIPVPSVEKIKCSKFFSKAIIGHDPFHRKFKSLSELYLQDYTEISQEVVLRYNEYYCNPYTKGSYLREKGRAANMVPSGKYEALLPMAGHPKHECTMYTKGGNCLYVDFTPDHINYCGEKSHPLPPLPHNQGNIDEGQFHPYTLSNEEIIHNSMKYHTNHCSVNCSQKCMVSYFREKQTT